jgi:hypothetical protein
MLQLAVQAVQFRSSEGHRIVERLLLEHAAQTPLPLTKDN